MTKKKKGFTICLLKNTTHTGRGGAEGGGEEGKRYSIDAVGLAHKLDTSQVLRYGHASPSFFLMHIQRF